MKYNYIPHEPKVERVILASTSPFGPQRLAILEDTGIFRRNELWIKFSPVHPIGEAGGEPPAVDPHSDPMMANIF